MPTSVLLAVLAAAGLLALAPALVRRYDATERLVAERAQSTARVLDRTRRRRTVPVSSRPAYPPPGRVSTATRVTAGPRPGAAPATSDLSVPGSLDVGSGLPGAREAGAPDGGPTARAAGSGPARDAGVGRAVWLPLGTGGSAPRTGSARGAGARPSLSRTPGPIRSGSATAAPARRRGTARRRTGGPVQPPVVYRRRRVLTFLIALNLIELIGVATVSAGFWTGFAVTMLLLVGYLVHLRNSAIADARRRQVEARRTARLAREQAEIRASHARRLAARREALRRAAAARATAQRDAQRLSQRYVDFDPQRGARVRGRSYEQGAGYDDRAAGF